MSPRKKHAPKDYSADQTKGSIICNLEKCAYLTATRLSSSTSNRYARPTAASGHRRKKWTLTTRPQTNGDSLAL